MQLAKSLAVVSAAIFISACGGGGDGAAVDNGLSSNTLSPGSSQTVAAGQSLPISAKALFRGTNVASMTWTVQPLQLSGAQDTPTLTNGNCAAITLTPATSVGATSQGYCESILTFPITATAGTWRVVNTALTVDGKSKSSSFDTSVQASQAIGFSLVEQALPATGQVGTLIFMNVPFLAQDGKSVSDIKYSWVAGPTNPALVNLVGKTSSTATFKPTAVGQYAFTVTAKGTVNGVVESASTSYILLVTQQSTDPIVAAGDILTKTVNTVVKLQGVITNRDASSVYSANWAQIAGAQGGPSRVVLANDATSTVSFVPSVIGTYGFTYTVTQTAADGTKKVVSASTQVIVSATETPVYTISAGDAQVGTMGAVVSLVGTISNQGSASSTYQWVQTGGQNVVLSNGNTTKATFIPTVEGSYTFNFVVSTPSTAGVTSVSASTQVVVK